MVQNTVYTCDVNHVRFVNIIKVTLFKMALIKATSDPFIKVSSDWVSMQYIQPKVLRMTQILISTKFAASVSLDIFVRCYYGILKCNYKHFISVKGFY